MRRPKHPARIADAEFHALQVYSLEPAGPEELAARIGLALRSLGSQQSKTGKAAKAFPGFAASL
jgi:hypothetical protein